MAGPDQTTGKGPGEGWVVAYAHWVIRWRWAVLVALGLAGSGSSLGFSTDDRIFFSKQNPQLQAFESLQKVYTKDDNILIVLQPKGGDVFTAAALEAVRDLTEASWQPPYSRRVDSMTNFQHSHAEGDDLTVEDLVPAGAELTSERLATIRAVALAEPLLVNRFVAPDSRTTGINVTLTLPGESEDEVLEAMTAARAGRRLRGRPSRHHGGGDRHRGAECGLQRGQRR